MNKDYRILFYTLTIVVVMVSYGFKVHQDNSAAEKLIGKWQLTEVFTSIGTKPKWTNVSASGKYVEFKKNNKLKGNAYLASKYSVKSNSLLVLDNVYNMDYSINNDTLTMHPGKPILCTEGCGSKFVKVKK